MSKIKMNNITTPTTFNISQNTPTPIEWNGRDDKMILFVNDYKGSTINVTIKRGDGVQGVEDLVFAMSEAGAYFITIDSGRFKNTSGENKGKIILEASDDLVFCSVLELE